MKRPTRAAEGSGATLNLTPTIDVVFLLLIFFIATIRLPEPEATIRAYLPRTQEVEGTGEREDEDKKDINRVVIALEPAAGRGLQIKLNGAVLSGGFSQLSAALNSLRHLARAEPDVETEIVLDADGQVPYRFVIEALDVCSRRGFSNVSFAMPRQDGADSQS
jgi:biopolymer transport protein ExbD